MDKEQITIALVQMNVSLGCPEKNLQRVEKLLEQVQETPNIILLPELWSSGYDYEHFTQLAATTPAMLEQMAKIAIRRGSHIGGSLVEADNGFFYNTFFLIDPKGNSLAAYRKIHLFSLMEEEQHFSPGQTPCLIEICGRPVGLMTCYDIRFPELSRTLALQGAQLLLVCAQWPQPRTAHWRTLLKARAIENQLFVAACNRIGQGSEHRYPGSSAIIDPWGETVLRAPQSQGAFSATLNFAKVKEVRQTIACFNDRRPEIYEDSDI
ncbi:MAG: carbon-nitrogen family hydrolase [Pseudomonadota bacterium]|nr:carbon-nitrogen family hydrolase [Pseudomonadota bacterium]